MFSPPLPLFLAPYSKSFLFDLTTHLSLFAGGVFETEMLVLCHNYLTFFFGANGFRQWNAPQIISWTIINP